MKIAILGSGTWGTALANAFIKKHDVSVYSRFEEESLKLRTSRIHPNLKGAILDEKIVFSSDLKEVIKDAKIIMVSAMGQKAMVVEAVKAGASDFIVKPFNEASIIRAFEKLTKK